VSRKDTMLAILRRERDAIEERMLRLEQVPDEDAYPDGTMIRVTTGAYPHQLTYLLLKVVHREPFRIDPTQDRWYFTGHIRRHSDQSWLTWDKVQSWLGEVGCESWDELIAKSDVPIDADHPAWQDLPSGKTLTTDLRSKS
jgi:hypothetical protein